MKLSHFYIKIYLSIITFSSLSPHALGQRVDTSLVAASEYSSSRLLVRSLVFEWFSQEDLEPALCAVAVIVATEVLQSDTFVCLDQIETSCGDEQTVEEAY